MQPSIMFRNCLNKWKPFWNKFVKNDARPPQEVAELIRQLGYEPVWKDWDAALTA